MDITGQVAVVTGGGSGIGAGTAKTLAAAGVRVALWDINAEGMQAVAEETGAHAFHCDVTDEQSVQQALAATIEALGTPRILIQCAGVLTAGRMVGKEGPAELEAFTNTILVNLTGTYNVMRIVAAAMCGSDVVGDDKERGIIINTASIAAFEGQIGQVAYSASKGGVVGMTLPAARELARFGVRVMAVAPGAVATPMIRQLPQEVQDAICSTIPFPSRFAEAEEFAKTCLHIVENPMLNGSVIRLDGAARLEPK